MAGAHISAPSSPCSPSSPSGPISLVVPSSPKSCLVVLRVLVVPCDSIKTHYQGRKTARNGETTALKRAIVLIKETPTYKKSSCSLSLQQWSKRLLHLETIHWWKGANLGLCGSTTTRSCKAAKSKAGAKVKAAPKAKTKAIMGKAIKIERYKLFLETVARIEELNALGNPAYGLT